MLRRYCGGDTAIADSGQDSRTTPITKHQRDSGPEKHQPLITHKIISRLKLVKILRFSPVSIIISPPLLPRVKICVISPALTLNLHFLEAVCRSESGNAVTSRPVSVQILLFPARAIGTGTHTRPVNHPRPRQKRGSVHPRARRSDIASHPPPLTRDAIGHPNSNNIIAIISLPRLPMLQFFSIQGSPSTISAVPSPCLTQKTSLDLHTIDHVHDAINTEPRIL